MKYYYYYVLFKIHLKKGARKMTKFWKNFMIGFVIGFIAVSWACVTITNSQMVLNEFVEWENV